MNGYKTLSGAILGVMIPIINAFFPEAQYDPAVLSATLDQILAGASAVVMLIGIVHKIIKAKAANAAG